jgi:hypothetical protein
MDRFSFLIGSQHRFLLIGIVILVIAVVFTVTGETVVRFHGMVSRAKEPKRFLGERSYVLSRRHFLYRALLVQQFKLRYRR